MDRAIAIVDRERTVVLIDVHLSIVLGQEADNPILVMTDLVRAASINDGGDDDDKDASSSWNEGSFEEVGDPDKAGFDGGKDGGLEAPMGNPNADQRSFPNCHGKDNPGVSLNL